jgi:hypothetical protein
MAWYDDILNTVTNSPATPGLLSAGVAAIGAGMMSNQSQQTQRDIAAGTQETARAAAEAAAFRPVGVTSRFGSSGFQYDPQGRLTGAGYQVAPDIAAQREALLGLSGGALTQAQQAQQSLAPAQQAAQSLFGLGGQFLPSSSSYSADPSTMAYGNQLRALGAQVTPQNYDTQAAAQQYIQQQQSLLAPGREQQLAGIRNNLQQTGRAGLATGATMAGGMGATNPELAAYYNSIAQQNASLGANANTIARGQLQQDITFGTGLTGQGVQAQVSGDEIARQRMLSNLSTGTGLYNSGIGLMNAGYGSQTAALAPYTSYLGGATSLEALGQNALTTGTALGSSQAAAGAQQGSLLNAGRLESNYALQNAARTQAATTSNAVTGASDPINQLISGLFQPPVQNQGYSQGTGPAYGGTTNNGFFTPNRQGM